MKFRADLSLCPFCGSSAYLDEYEGEITVGCPDCGVHCHGFDQEQKAVDVWNKRVTELERKAGES